MFDVLLEYEDTDGDMVRARLLVSDKSSSDGARSSFLCFALLCFGLLRRPVPVLKRIVSWIFFYLENHILVSTIKPETNKFSCVFSRLS